MLRLFRTLLTCSFGVAMIAAVASDVESNQPTPVSVTSIPEAVTPAATPFSCPITLPNGTAPPGMPPSPTLHGNGKLWVTLHADGRIPVRPENVSPSGWLGVKLPWWRAVRGTLTIEARRLDAPARPARATVPDGYGDIGFQASGVLFPSPGCWEVTGRVGESSLTFVVLIELAGEADGFPATPEATP